MSLLLTAYCSYSVTLCVVNCLSDAHGPLPGQPSVNAWLLTKLTLKGAVFSFKFSSRPLTTLSRAVQVIALMVLSMTHLLFLRFIEPLCERGELAVQLVAEICDVGVFVCGLVLILGDSSNDKFRWECLA